MKIEEAMVFVNPFDDADEEVKSLFVGNRIHTLVVLNDCIYDVHVGYYSRATRCGGDIVTLLWIRVSVCPSLHGPCERDRN